MYKIYTSTTKKAQEGSTDRNQKSAGGIGHNHIYIYESILSVIVFLSLYIYI